MAMVCVYSLIVITLLASVQGELSCRPPCLYFVADSSISRFKINTNTGNKQGAIEKVLDIGADIWRFAIDPVNKKLYTVSVSGTIYKSNLNGTDNKKLPFIGSIHKLAFDWTSNNIYFLDSNEKTVQVYNVKNQFKKVLFQLDADVLSICVNPIAGLLFWSSSRENTAQIERASLAGQNRSTIVKIGLGHPEDLSIDYENKRLLWIDTVKNEIRSSNFDGSNKRFVYRIKHTVSFGFSLAYYAKKKIAYVSDWYSLYNVKNTPRPSGRKMVFTKDRSTRIEEIRMITNYNYSGASTPCLSSKNNCSHLCLTKPNNEFECACPTGMKISSNQSETCVEAERDFEIYFANKGNRTIDHLIKYIGHHGTKVSALTTPSIATLQSPSALDFDPYERFIYWSDKKTKNVYRMKENGLNFSTILLSQNTAGIAVDKVRKILYWFGEHTLMMSTLDGRHKKSFLDAKVIKPGDLELYEEMGWIYYSELNSDLIYRIKNDGTESIHSVFKVYATGIAIDKIDKRIYWCDKSEQGIKFSDLELTTVHVLRKSRYFLSNPYSISMFGEKVIWSDIKANGIFAINKRTGKDLEHIAEGLNQPQDLHVYTSKPAIEYRRIYLFKSLNRGKRPKCFGSKSKCNSFVSKNKNKISKPAACPIGYNQSNFTQSCSYCKYSHGEPERCPCTNWMTCAQRFYGYRHGCTQHPFTFFTVRECSQAVKPGYCKFISGNICPVNSTDCSSDSDCPENDKCCKTNCGRKCYGATEKPNIPCTVRNGGCSHFCVGDFLKYKCMCPDGMILDQTNKTCIKKQNKICLLPMNRGSCSWWTWWRNTFWHYDREEKKCMEKYGCEQGRNANFFPDKKSCKDECEVNIPPTMTPTKTVSKQTDERKAYLYYTDGVSIYRIPSSGGNFIYEKREKLITPGSYIASFDIDTVNKELYIGGISNSGINKTSLEGKNSTVLLSIAVGYPIQLAFDSSSNNLYWINNLKNTIEVFNVKNSYRKVLFKFDKDEMPQSLSVSPQEGYIFWSNIGKASKIERSTLSGKSRKTIAKTSLGKPTGITIDDEDGRLLWIDSTTYRVESVDFNGTNQRSMFEIKKRQNYETVHSLAYNPTTKMAFVTDYDLLFSIQNTSSKTLEKSIVFGRFGTPFNVKILLNSTSNASTPCLSSKNNCSHLCLTKPNNEFECACPTGMKISSNQSETCVKAEKDFEIYFADKEERTISHLIKYVDQNGITLSPLPIPSNATLQSPSALDYDPYQKFIYWTDIENKKTYRMKNNGESFSVVLPSSGSVGIAVDKLTKIMYWFDEDSRQTLMMSTTDGKHSKSLYYDYLTNPRDITLYEEKGLIYFSNNNYMIRLNTDGSGYLQSSVTTVTTGMAVDKLEDKLYWCDKFDFTINFAELDFTNHRVIIQSVDHAESVIGHVEHPFGIAIMGEEVFWSDVKKNAIFSSDKRTGINTRYIAGGLHHPQDLHVYSDKVRIDSVDHRRIYLFSYVKENPNSIVSYTPKCFSTNTSCYEYMAYHNISDPPPCPSGYADNDQVFSTCAMCTFNQNGVRHCPCDNWMTCAQRNYGEDQNCDTIHPFMYFKVRECTQVVRPGYCMRNASSACPTRNCTADSDCAFHHKCCQTKCGMKCTKLSTKPDTPCTVNNGGCSHFCVGDLLHHKCMCPDGMTLGQDNRTCIVGQNSVCRTKRPQHWCLSAKKRWYFDNSGSKRCEFMRSTCEESTSKNNFNTKTQCKRICEVNPASTTSSPNTTPRGQNTTMSTTVFTTTDAPITTPWGPIATTSTTVFTTTDVDAISTTNSTAQTTKPGCGCLNGGTCDYSFFIPLCTCVTPWYGPKCQINPGGNHVKTAFRKMGSIQITLELFKKKFAAIFSLFCTQSNSCIFIAILSPQRRRRSTPSNITFSEDDILINDFESNNGSVSFDLAVRQPSNSGGDLKILSKASLEEGLNKYAGNISEDLQFQPLKTSPSQPSTDDSSNTTMIAVVTLAIILVLVMLVITILYVRKKRNEKSQNIPSVRFENHMYDDLHPEEKATVPPTSDKDEARAVSNPAYVSADELWSGLSKAETEDVAPREEKKTPVIDFVEADLSNPL